MHRIRIEEKDIKHQQKFLKEQLSNVRTASQSSLTITVPLTITNHEKAILEFTPEAMQCMKALVRACSKEIAWHGTVNKTVAGKQTVYTIDNIIMFPQEVTAATVKGIPTEYAMWNAQLPDDIYNRMRFHGHSHVNMSTGPSGVDTNYQEEMIETLEDFYIFLIINKRDEVWVKIVDVEDNIVYDKTDVTIRTQGELAHDEWAAAQIKQYLKEQTVPTARPITTGRPATVSGGYANYQQMVLKQIEENKAKEAEEKEDATDHDYWGAYGYGHPWYTNYRD